jgi:hypothetical protein
VKRLAWLSMLAAACSSKPVMDARGEPVTEIRFEERFALDAEGKSKSFRGDELKQTVELLDKNGVLALDGTFAATGVVDQSQVDVVVVTGANGGRGEGRRIVVKNCAEPHLCAFFADAKKSGLVEHIPGVCRDTTPCAPASR